MAFFPDDATRIRSAQRCTWVFALFTAMCCYGVWSENQRTTHNTDIALHSANTIGTVSYVHTGKGGLWFNYRYSAAGVEYEGKGNGSAPSGGYPITGESISVTYSSTHPGWSVAGTLEQQSGSHAGLFFLGALACAAIALFSYRTVRRSHLSSD